MIQIPLSNEKGFALIDDDDYELVKDYSWHLHVVGNNEYARAWINGRREYMHRVILPNAKLIDHKDMNGLNNQRSNISEVTKSENGINSRLRKDNQTGYRGIYPHKASGKFVVYGQSEAGGF